MKEHEDHFNLPREAMIRDPDKIMPVPGEDWIYISSYTPTADGKHYHVNVNKAVNDNDPDRTGPLTPNVLHKQNQLRIIAARKSHKRIGKLPVYLQQWPDRIEGMPAAGVVNGGAYKYTRILSHMGRVGKGKTIVGGRTTHHIVHPENNNTAHVLAVKHYGEHVKSIPSKVPQNITDQYDWLTDYNMDRKRFLDAHKKNLRDRRISMHSATEAKALMATTNKVVSMGAKKRKSRGLRVH